MFTSRTTLLLATAMTLMMLLLLPTAAAFTAIRPAHSIRPPSTRLYLEDWVADLIDHELDRQNHKKEFEEAWMKKNRGAVTSRLQQDFMPAEPADEDFRMHAKDVRMAKNHPDRYCADRCVSTGNCDVFEDFFDMSPEEVLQFCEECVLSDSQDPCDVPDAFYDKLSP